MTDGDDGDGGPLGPARVVVNTVGRAPRGGTPRVADSSAADAEPLSFITALTEPRAPPPRERERARLPAGALDRAACKTLAVTLGPPLTMLGTRIMAAVFSGCGPEH